ncbi:MAG: MgtC/SapB family protein, partial [Mariprofundaceae bacterium]
MDLQIGLLTQTLAALGIGLLIGLEREYHQRHIGEHVKHPGAAGIRTFALITLSGNLLTLLPEALMPWGIAMGMAFTGLMALFSYRRTSADTDTGITTEIAMVVTFILGVLTGLGYLLHATVIAAIVFCLLRFKKVLHHFSHSLSRMDLTQATQFLIISAVVLPILPNTAFGPYAALNPQRIWLMVVLISGI